MEFRVALLSTLLVVPLACGSDRTDNNPGGSPPAKKASAIALQFDTASVPLGLTTQWKASATFDDGSTGDVTDKVTWQSSNTSVAEMSEQRDQRGVLITKSPGTTVVIAKLDKLSVSENFTVGAALLESIELSPTQITLGNGAQLRLKVTAKYGDDSRKEVTRDATWESSNPTVGMMSATDKGTFQTFGREGMTTITATYEGKTATAEFTVTAASVERLELTPDDPRIETGSSMALSARGIYTDDRVVDGMNTQLTWTSSDEAVATVNTRGVVTGVASGQARITATIGGVSASVDIRVHNPGECNYPEPAARIQLGQTMPKLSWLDAFKSDGSLTDFRLEEFSCNSTYSQYKSVAFIVGAGWCPNCPAYMQALNEMAPELEANGMLLVYMEIETRTRQPSSNEQSQDIVERVLGPGGAGIRIGDADTMPTAGAFSQVVSAVPTAYVVRKSDMKVVADRMQSSGEIDFVAIAQNPDAF